MEKKYKRFTPLFDDYIEEVGLQKAAILGVILQYSNMEEKVCRASQTSIAKRIGLSRQTVNKYINELTKAGYLEDLTPSTIKAPHKYILTKKVSIYQDQISNNDLSKSEQVIVKNTDTIINKLKERYKDKYIYSESEINEDFSTKDILLFSSSKEYPLAISRILSSSNDFEDSISLIMMILQDLSFTYEMDSQRLNHSEISFLSYIITPRGVDKIKDHFGNKAEIVDIERLECTTVFWFWYCLAGHAEIDDLDLLLSIYDTGFEDLEARNPSIYSESQEIDAITTITGKAPPIELFPKIYWSFDFSKGSGQLSLINKYYVAWISRGYRKENYEWFFDWYVNKKDHYLEAKVKKTESFDENDKYKKDRIKYNHQ